MTKENQLCLGFSYANESRRFRIELGLIFIPKSLFVISYNFLSSSLLRYSDPLHSIKIFSSVYNLLHLLHLFNYLSHHLYISS